MPSANNASSATSTPSSSKKLPVLLGIIPRDLNQRALTVNSLSPKCQFDLAIVGTDLKGCIVLAKFQTLPGSVLWSPALASL
ncbi:unnamed protein product [Nezara viridula]|uniref:Uncharacterized protein n=1 Tax=Nezara viridula TaxID=85310 RepID=A0A9P0MP68_NEZVI|nr:unnamed protein product [Nezara viridula]